MTKKIAPIDCPQQVKKSLTQFSQFLEDEELLRVLTHHQYAKNSLISMKNDWNNFLLFCLDKSVSPLPASVTAVRLYIEKQAQTKKLSTIKRYLVTIGLLHRCHSLQDPTNHRQVRFLVKSLQIEKKDDNLADADKMITKFNEFSYMQRTLKVRIANDPKHPEEETA